MLHVGGTGILKHIFEYLDNLIAGDIDKETFDDLHRQLVKDAQRQSERDFTGFLKMVPFGTLYPGCTTLKIT